MNIIFLTLLLNLVVKQIDFTVLFGIVISAFTIVALYKEYRGNKIDCQKMHDDIEDLKKKRELDLTVMKKMNKMIAEHNRILKKKSSF